MFSQLQVSTPEGVTFRHDLAGIGSRSVATAIDILIFITVLFFVTAITALGAAALKISPELYFVFLLLFIFAYLWLYRLVFEARSSAAIGYRVMGLKVVTKRGAKPMFWQCAVRSLFWPLECVQMSLVALVAIMVTPNQQRLGDLISGTVVVHRNRETMLGTLQVQQAALDPNAPFRNWELSQVDDDDVYLIRRFLDRRTRLSPGIRLAMANDLYQYIWPKVSGIPTNWYAEAVLEGIAASRAVANER